MLRFSKVSEFGGSMAYIAIFRTARAKEKPCIKKKNHKKKKKNNPPQKKTS